MVGESPFCTSHRLTQGVCFCVSVSPRGRMAAPSPVPGVGLETETALCQWPLSGSQAALISQDRSRAFWTTVSRWAGPVWEPVCLAAPGCAREGWDGTGGRAGCRSRVELPALEQLSLLQVSEGQATGRSRTRLALSGAVSEPAAPPREVVPAAQQMGEVVCPPGATRRLGLSPRP